MAEEPFSSKLLIVTRVLKDGVLIITIISYYYYFYLLSISMTHDDTRPW